MLNLKIIPVTVSDVLSWNDLQDLSQSHSEEEVIVVPQCIPGSSAKIFYSKRGNYAVVESHKIKIFESIEECWKDALYDTKGDEKKAEELVESLAWWTTI